MENYMQIVRNFLLMKPRLVKRKSIGWGEEKDV